MIGGKIIGWGRRKDGQPYPKQITGNPTSTLHDVNPPNSYSRRTVSTFQIPLKKARVATDEIRRARIARKENLEQEIKSRKLDKEREDAIAQINYHTNLFNRIAKSQHAKTELNTVTDVVRREREQKILPTTTGAVASTSSRTPIPAEELAKDRREYVAHPEEKNTKAPFQSNPSGGNAQSPRSSSMPMEKVSKETLTKSEGQNFMNSVMQIIHKQGSNADKANEIDRLILQHSNKLSPTDKKYFEKMSKNMRREENISTKFVEKMTNIQNKFNEKDQAQQEPVSKKDLKKLDKVQEQVQQRNAELEKIYKEQIRQQNEQMRRETQEDLRANIIQPEPKHGIGESARDAVLSKRQSLDDALNQKGNVLL